MSGKRSKSAKQTGGNSWKTLAVAPQGDEWLVKRDGAARATSVHPSQKDAIDAANAMLRTDGGEIRIHGRDGRIRESTTLGRKAAAKISAVEGISLEGAIGRDLKGFDREGLSPEERRKRIWEKYAAGSKIKR